MSYGRDGYDGPLDPGTPGLTAAEVRALRADLKVAEDARSLDEAHRRQGNARVVVLLGLLLIGVTVWVQMLWHGHEAGAQQWRTQRIEDCVTPGGRCHRQEQAEAAATADDLRRRQLFVAECAQQHRAATGPRFDRLVTECVAARRTAVDRARPAPTPGPR